MRRLDGRAGAAAGARPAARLASCHRAQLACSRQLFIRRHQEHTAPVLLVGLQGGLASDNCSSSASSAAAVGSLDGGQWRPGAGRGGERRWPAGRRAAPRRRRRGRRHNCCHVQSGSAVCAVVAKLQIMLTGKAQHFTHKKATQDTALLSHASATSRPDSSPRHNVHPAPALQFLTAHPHVAGVPTAGAPRGPGAQALPPTPSTVLQRTLCCVHASL